MIKKKKLDDLELVFIDEPWTKEERKSFSAFLKARKLKLHSGKHIRTKATRPIKQYA